MLTAAVSLLLHGATICPDRIVLPAMAPQWSASIDGFAPMRRAARLDAMGADPSNDRVTAAARIAFPGCQRTYRVTLHTLAEPSGEARFAVHAGAALVGAGQNPATQTPFAAKQLPIGTVELSPGDAITVSVLPHTNGRVPEKRYTAYASGWWQAVSFDVVMAPKAE